MELEGMQNNQNTSEKTKIKNGHCLTSKPSINVSDQDNVALAEGQINEVRKRIQRVQIDPHIYGQLIFVKGVQVIQWEKKSLFNKCSC